MLGDSVTQFSLVIGVYLSASLGLGAWLSGYIDENLARGFVEVELAVALVGGVSAPLILQFLPFGLVSARSVRHRARDRRAGRSRTAPLDADSQGSPRLPRSGLPRADLRLHRRPLGFDPVSDVPRAATRTRADLPALRHAQRGRRAVGDLLTAAPAPRGGTRAAVCEFGAGLVLVLLDRRVLLRPTV